MTKPFSTSDDQVKHWVMPEVTGKIVGMTTEGLRPQTVEEMQAMQQQARDEAYQEGLKRGLADMQAKAKKLVDALNFAARPLQQLDDDVVKQLTELSITLARMLLKKECCTDATHIHALIHEALDFLPVSSRNIRVRLNPADMDLLNQAGIDTKKQDWQCIADRGISQGGCQIETDTSHIDATVETRLQQLVDQLLEQRPHPLDEGNKP
jgi:flagellar assembly protein FliH